MRHRDCFPQDIHARGTPALLRDADAILHVQMCTNQTDGNAPLMALFSELSSLRTKMSFTYNIVKHDFLNRKKKVEKLIAKHDWIKKTEKPLRPEETKSHFRGFLKMKLCICRECRGCGLLPRLISNLSW